jgi:hypothetical protein
MLLGMAAALLEYTRMEIETKRERVGEKQRKSCCYRNSHKFIGQVTAR